MEQGRVFCEFVAEGAAEPADELEAVLGDPAGRLDDCWHHQTLLRADLGGLVGALVSADVFGPVGDSVFVLQSLPVEEGPTTHDRRIGPRSGFDPPASLRHPEFQRTDLAAQHTLFLGSPPSGQMRG